MSKTQDNQRLFGVSNYVGHLKQSDVQYIPSSHIQIECVCGHVYVCCEHGCENMDDEKADAMANVSSPIDIGLYTVRKMSTRLPER